MLPGVSRIRCPHTPGSNLPAPVSKPRSCVSRACSRIPIEQLLLFFQSKACHCAGFAFFLSFPAGLFRCTGAVRRAGCAVYFPLFPTYAMRCPSSGRTNGRFSKKPPDNSEKRGAIGVNTEAFLAYSTVYRLFLRRRAAYPRCILNLCEEGKHRVPILCINFAAFTLFPSAGKLSESTFRLHPYSFHRPFYNKTHSPRSLSQQSQNSQPKIPTCSDCPRTILYLISHFKNFSL